jgi:hypothetical protein
VIVEEVKVSVRQQQSDVYRWIGGKEIGDDGEDDSAAPPAAAPPHISRFVLRPRLTRDLVRC